MRALRNLFGLRVPNTGVAAIVVSVAVAIVGFSLGLVFLLVIPSLRDSGLPGFSPRAGRVIDVRSRLPGQPVPTPNLERPELWMTPVARVAFPSERHLDRLGRGAVSATYRPGQPPILPLPPLKDAIGRPLVALVATFSGHYNVATPEPDLPVTTEATQLTLAVPIPGESTVSACTLVATGDRLSVLAASGRATREGCADGILELEEDAIAFAVLYDQLPNYRTRGGIWYPGMALGTTEIRVALIDSAGVAGSGESQD